MSAIKTAVFPVPPRIRLRVGVTGHRAPPKLPTTSEVQLRNVVDRILAVICDAARSLENDYTWCTQLQARHHSVGKRCYYSTGKNTKELVIISSLAEGADSIVAEAALAAGFRLEGVLPLNRAEYARDFQKPEGGKTLERLLGCASAIFELNGAADERPRAYEAAGFVMLGNVDLLIAVWDGNEAVGVGGTGQIVSRAIAHGIPIIWVEPENLNALRISWPRAGDLPPANIGARPKDAFRSGDENTIAVIVNELLRLPTHIDTRKSLETYLMERPRRWNFCLWYPLLFWLFTGFRLQANVFHLLPALIVRKAQWERYLLAVPKDRSQHPVIEEILLPAFMITDNLAIYYSLVYRSTYVFNFVFAGAAVALALSGIFVRDDPISKSYLVIAELFTIATILMTWMWGHYKQWHRRWLEYRRLAESLRHMRILAPVGAGGPIDTPGRSVDIDEQDWVNWYARSLRRMLPLADRSVDSHYLTAIRDAVCGTEIAEQIRYHTENANRIARLDPRMQRAGQVLFAITGALCIVFVCLVWFAAPLDNKPEEDLLLGAFSFASALLPTLGAALAAIHAQGDFKTVAEQSKRTAKRLTAIASILGDEPLTLARLRDRIEKASDIMMADLLEWQIVFRSRPLSLPA